jgi:predicted metalloprotease
MRLLASLVATVSLVVAGTVAVPSSAASASTSSGAFDSTSSGSTSFDSTSFASAAIDDLQAFWADSLPEVYDRGYESIPDDRLHPYSSDDPPPACGDRGTTPYEEVAGNAFYCSVGDFVAWDTQELFPRLEQRHGRFAVALVLAHEWGHAIQARTDSSISATIYLENQADCFAGAWAHHVEAGDDTSLSFGASDLDAALSGYLEFRDPPGVDPSHEGAHGNGFDRVSAFQDGFEAGVGQCATYEHDPPEVTESPYTTYEDQASGGDMALDEAVDLVKTDLDEYWAAQLDGSPVSDVAVVADADAGCEGTSDGGVLVDGVTYCTTGDTVVYDPDVLSRVYDSTGDFGAGMLLATAWSSAAQHDLGLSIHGAAARLRADCLTGAWAGDVARGVRSGSGSASDSQLSLSPGDLDQGIATFVSLGGTDDDRGSAFTRVDAFRTGFFDGVDACTTRTA